MVENQTQKQGWELLNHKAIKDFLDDAYSLSNSSKTVELYKHVLRSFDRFCTPTYKKNIMELIEDLKLKPIRETLEVLLQYKRYQDNHVTKHGSTTSNTTKIVRLSVLKNFCRSCGINIHHEDIRDHIKIGRKMRVQKMALDHQTVSKIINTVERFEFKTLTVLLACTGMRVMETITLQPSDFDFGSHPVVVRVRAKETKTNEGRSVYLTTECAGMVEQLIVNKPDSQKYLFGRYADPYEIYRTYGRFVRSALKKLGLYKILDNGVNQITPHSLRSFFRTYAGHIISRDFAESYIGHRFYLSEYENMPEEEKKKLFLQLEPHMTFSHVKVRTKTSNPEIITLEKQLEDLRNKIMILGQKFLSENNLTNKQYSETAEVQCQSIN